MCAQYSVCVASDVDMCVILCDVHPHQIPLCGYGGTSNVELVNVPKSSGGHLLDLGQVRQRRERKGRREGEWMRRMVEGRGMHTLWYLTPVVALLLLCVP